MVSVPGYCEISADTKDESAHTGHDWPDESHDRQVDAIEARWNLKDHRHDDIDAHVEQQQARAAQDE